MLSPAYEIATDLMPYGRVNKSYVWDRSAAAMSSDGMLSYVSDNNKPYVIQGN